MIQDDFGNLAENTRAGSWWAKYHLRVNLGWKLSWAAERVQIATHINPLRKWKD